MAQAGPLAAFITRATLDLEMPVPAAIAGNTRAYLRLDTPDTRISLMRAQPAIAVQPSYSGMATSRPGRPRVPARLAYFEPPLQQADLSALTAMPEHLPL